MGGVQGFSSGPNSTAAETDSSSPTTMNWFFFLNYHELSHLPPKTAHMSKDRLIFSMQLRDLGLDILLLLLVSQNVSLQLTIQHQKTSNMVWVIVSCTLNICLPFFCCISGSNRKTSVLRLLSTWGTFNCTSRKTNQRSIHRALKLFPLCKIPIQIKIVYKPKSLPQE